MPTQFNYDSRDFHQPYNRFRRFYLFLTVLMFLVFALNFSRLYYTDWSPGDATRNKQLWLAAALFFGLMSLAGIALVVTKWVKRGYGNYQLLSIDDESIRWRFAGESVNEVKIADIDSYRSDPRHLILQPRNGEEIWIENYLIRDPEQWPLFMDEVVRRLELADA